MKKFIIAAALILTTGVLASQTKSNATPSVQQAPVIVKPTFSASSKELASGD